MKKTLWRVSIEGGEPIQLTAFHATRPALSPDGRLIAFYFIDHSHNDSPWRIGVVSFNRGEMVKKFDVPAAVTSRFVNWTADSQSIAYIKDTGSISNIWIQPLSGERPRQITNFQAGRILAFDWSQDGRQIVFLHAIESSYVALINLTNGL